MTLALVFAMTGGAYAAKRYVITSTKQISPTVLKRLAGKGGPAGANGAQGPAGAAGAKGENGAAGPEGKAGAPGNDGTGGESVVMKAEPKGTHCKEGGANFTVGGKTEYACNGSPWTAGGTLPKGATEKGAWTASGDASEEAGIISTGVSFNIPPRDGTNGPLHRRRRRTHHHGQAAVHDLHRIAREPNRARRSTLRLRQPQHRRILRSRTQRTPAQMEMGHIGNRLHQYRTVAQYRRAIRILRRGPIRRPRIHQLRRIMGRDGLKGVKVEPRR